ncbi:MAG: YciC family protein [Plesiomonas sp.]|uniref:YciC family protein n=1 Tax=Plesiomonas sp. TaxID=2486279 RepID=UPI003F35B823
MPTNANLLFRDSINFIRNNLNTVLLLSLLAALIVVIAEHFMLSGINTVEMSQQDIAIKTMRAQTMLNILSTPLFNGCLLSLVILSTRGNTANISTAIQAGVPLYFAMLGVEVLSGLATFAGAVALILPGIYVAIRLALAPCFLAAEGQNMIEALKSSWHASKPWMKLILQGYLIIYLGIRLPVVYLISALDNSLQMNSSLFALLVSIVYNLTSALMLIFLFRLYMLEIFKRAETVSEQ